MTNVAGMLSSPSTIKNIRLTPRRWHRAFVPAVGDPDLCSFDARDFGSRGAIAARGAAPRSDRRPQLMVRRFFPGLPIDRHIRRAHFDLYGAPRSHPIPRRPARGGPAQLSQGQVSRAADRHPGGAGILRARIRDALARGAVARSARGIYRGRRGDRGSAEAPFRRDRNDLSSAVPQHGDRRTSAGAESEADRAARRLLGAASRPPKLQGRDSRLRRRIRDPRPHRPADDRAQKACGWPAV